MKNCRSLSSCLMCGIVERLKTLGCLKRVGTEGLLVKFCSLVSLRQVMREDPNLGNL